MKLAFFNEFRLGVIQDSQIVDVHDVLPKKEWDHPQYAMEYVIKHWAEVRGPLEDAARKGKALPLAQVRLRPPLPKPTKLVCCALNYLEFGKRSMPDRDAFIKSSNAIIGNGDTVVLPPVKATIFHHEAELALVIGKRATRVKAADWKEYVFGYTQFMDISARGINPNGRISYFWQKSFDTFAPMGPALVSADEVPDPQDLRVRMWVDDQPRHDFNTDDMAYKIPDIIEFVSSICTLEPGDVVATGTNHQGIGPIQDGETVRLEVERLGPPLVVHVRDPQKRTWPKKVDEEFARAAASR